MKNLSTMLLAAGAALTLNSCKAPDSNSVESARPVETIQKQEDTVPAEKTPLPKKELKNIDDLREQLEALGLGYIDSGNSAKTPPTEEQLKALEDSLKEKPNIEGRKNDGSPTNKPLHKARH